MGVRQLLEDAVGAQQAKLQIPITQAVEGELAPVDRFQQSVIVRIG
jgi:hypothetical protein